MAMKKNNGSPMLMVGTSADKLTAISRDPSKMEWGIQDISSADAGRTQDGVMHKMLVTKKRKIELEWVLPNAEEASEIIKAFDPEYVYVRYWDVMDNRFETRHFYSGDKTAPFKWFQLPAGNPAFGTKFATVSFNIIEV